MRKTIWITMLFFTLCFSVPLLANANNDSDFDTYGVKNYEVISSQMEEIEPLMRSTFSTDSSWLTLPSKQNVDLNKEWTITFSGGTVSLDKIAGIVIERNGVFIPVRVRLFPAANQAIVTPQENYLVGENYTVRAFLENGLRYKMSFTTKSEITTASSYGNTFGNIANGGIVAESNGWIYYSNSNDNHKLYKMKIDGTEVTKLSERSAKYINVIGGWVYFFDSSISYIKDIYKIRISGTNEAKISSGADNGLLVNDSGHIFYAQSAASMISVVDHDGKNGIGNLYTNGRHLAFSNNSLITTHSGSQNLLSVKPKGDSTSIFGGITTTLVNRRVTDLNVIDSWIYYLDITEKNIYKIKTDGTNKQKLNSQFTSDINVYGNWIFFVNDENQAIYKIKTDGTSLTQLNDSPSDTINVIAEWIYYEDPYTNKYYRMKHNGANWQEVK